MGPSTVTTPVSALMERTGSIAGGDGVGSGTTIDIDGGESGDDGAIGRIFSDGVLSVREVWSLVHIGDGNGGIA